MSLQEGLEQIVNSGIVVVVVVVMVLSVPSVLAGGTVADSK